LLLADGTMPAGRGRAMAIHCSMQSAAGLCRHLLAEPVDWPAWPGLRLATVGTAAKHVLPIKPLTDRTALSACCLANSALPGLSAPSETQPVPRIIHRRIIARYHQHSKAAPRLPCSRVPMAVHVSSSMTAMWHSKTVARPHLLAEPACGFLADRAACLPAWCLTLH
jgi:hypothetical protein